jgi:hypothetical protein
LLLRRAEKIKTRFGEDIRIGRFAGFDLFIRSGFNNTAELVLRGKNSYSTRVTDTALGTIRSLESTVQGFEERATRLESDIKDSQKRATELEAKVGSPFEKEERYHHLANASRKSRSSLTSPRIRHPARWMPSNRSAIPRATAQSSSPRKHWNNSAATRNGLPAPVMPLPAIGGSATPTKQPLRKGRSPFSKVAQELLHSAEPLLRT